MRRYLLVFLLLSCLPLTARPKIGLALSGGGARGFAHVGVLEYLKEHKIPVDYISGSSIGAIVGGLYASGMSPERMKTELANANWRNLLSSSAPRENMSYRYRVDTARHVLELGLNNWKLSGPDALVSGHNLLLKLRELTAPVADIQSFNELPIPFHAVATDLLTGNAVVLREGDLAEAMRASCAIPGVISPWRKDGQILADGFLSRNMPVDVVRKMGADVIIAIDVHEDLAKENELDSALQISGQMLLIMGSEGRKIQERLLTEEDLHIRVPLPSFTQGDFENALTIAAEGYMAAAEMRDSLASFQVGEEEYERHSTKFYHREGFPFRPSFIRVAESGNIPKEAVANRISASTGSSFRLDDLKNDMADIQAMADFQSVDYYPVKSNDEWGINISAREKEWGPGILLLGLSLESDLSRHSGFRFRLSWQRKELNARGAEFRTDLELSDGRILSGEYLQYLDDGRRFFLASALSLARHTTRLDVSSTNAPELFTQSSREARFVLGTRPSRFSEARLGVEASHTATEKFSNMPASFDLEQYDQSLVFGLGYRSLDNPWFPSRGFAFDSVMRYSVKHRDGGRLRTELYKPLSLESLTFLPRLIADIEYDGDSEVPLRVGGLFDMSGLPYRRVLGGNKVFAQLLIYKQTTRIPLGLGNGVYAGFSLDSGQIQNEKSDFRFREFQSGASLFFGADSVLGPIYLSAGINQEGQSAASISLGPFF